MFFGYLANSGQGGDAGVGHHDVRLHPISSTKRSMPKSHSGFDCHKVDPHRHAGQQGHTGQLLEVLPRAGHQAVDVRAACVVGHLPSAGALVALAVRHSIGIHWYR
jgi:hypothetical protein